MQREEMDWGVQLVDKPFTHKHTGMFIQADIMRPRIKGRAADIKFYFSGALEPLRSTDVIIWREHLKAVSDAARDEATKMKQTVGKKRKAKK
jgi:hypothetical protein